MTFESMSELTDLVVLWAKDRNLIEGSTPERQLEKLAGELVELSIAVANDKDAATNGAIYGTEVASEIGDMLVVLTIISEQLGFYIDDCLRTAYHKIKDRKGRMINGQFVKEEDL